MIKYYHSPETEWTEPGIYKVDTNQMYRESPAGVPLYRCEILTLNRHGLRLGWMKNVFPYKGEEEFREITKEEATMIAMETT